MRWYEYSGLDQTGFPSIWRVWSLESWSRFTRELKPWNHHWINYVTTFNRSFDVKATYRVSQKNDGDNDVIILMWHLDIFLGNPVKWFLLSTHYFWQFLIHYSADSSNLLLVQKNNLYLIVRHVKFLKTWYSVKTL